MSAPFDPELVMARLRLLPDLQLVEGAAEYAAITQLRDFRAASAYVLLAREDADAQPGAAAGRQRALVTFAVVLATNAYADSRGAAAAAAVRPLVGAVRTQLIGWTPAVQGGRPVHWLQGDVLDYDANIILWREIYQTQHFIGPGA
jgi:hypothetical protein